MKIHGETGHFTEEYLDTVYSSSAFTPSRVKEPEGKEATKKSMDLAREVLPSEVFNSLVVTAQAMFSVKHLNLSVAMQLFNTSVTIQDENGIETYCVIQDANIPHWDRIVTLYLMSQSKEGIEKIRGKGNVITISDFTGEYVEQTDEAYNRTATWTVTYNGFQTNFANGNILMTCTT
jgi:hypothetical protein